MSSTSKPRPCVAACDAEAPDGADAAQSTGSAETRSAGRPNDLGGDRVAVRTEQSSGIRSSTGGGPALAATLHPWPTGPGLPELAQEVGDDQVMRRFVTDYLSLLNERLDTLGSLLVRHECPEKIRVAILSLETTSAMLGATDVVSAASALRTTVASRQPSDIEMLFDRLRSAAEQLQQRLADQGFTAPQPHPADEQPVDSRRRGPSRRSAES